MTHHFNQIVTAHNLQQSTQKKTKQNKEIITTTFSWKGMSHRIDKTCIINIKEYFENEQHTSSRQTSVGIYILRKNLNNESEKTEEINLK